LNPPIQETVETVQNIGTTASVISHIKENRIEYLALTILLHLLGISDYVLDKTSGVCL